MQYKPLINFMGILVQMINTGGIEQRRTPFDAMYLVPFVKEDFG
jgi:hypothetical protein